MMGDSGERGRRYFEVGDHIIMTLDRDRCFRIANITDRASVTKADITLGKDGWYRKSTGKILFEDPARADKRAEQERAKQAEQERAKQAEQERVEQVEQERAKQAEEERVKRLEQDRPKTTQKDQETESEGGRMGSTSTGSPIFANPPADSDMAEDGTI
jgi:hypothetical protein